MVHVGRRRGNIDRAVRRATTTAWLLTIAEGAGAERCWQDRDGWRARLRQYQGAGHRPVNERDGWLCLDDPDEYDFMACRWPVLSDDFVPGPPATGPGRLR